jgi:hypothetical protein
VSFCPPATDVFLEARRRGYLHRGACPGELEPMLKVLAGLPGDEVLQTSEALFINGRELPHSKALEADAQGRPLPALAARRFAVRAGQGSLSATILAASTAGTSVLCRLPQLKVRRAPFSQRTDAQVCSSLKWRPPHDSEQTFAAGARCAYLQGLPLAEVSATKICCASRR